MTQINGSILTDKETHLLAELVAIKEQKRRRDERDARAAIAYTVTPYGAVPTQAWVAYCAARDEPAAAPTQTWDEHNAIRFIAGGL